MTIPPSQPPLPPPPPPPPPPGCQHDLHDQTGERAPDEKVSAVAASPTSPAPPVSSSIPVKRDLSSADSTLPVVSLGSAQHAGGLTSGGRGTQPPIRRWQPTREDVTLRAARVKHACRIEEVISRYGVELTPVAGGRRLVGLCPFHAERHGSFTVYADTQSFCCFGCHAAGDVITFVCLVEHVRFNEALRLLGEVQEPAARDVGARYPSARRGSGMERAETTAAGASPPAGAPASAPILVFPSRDQSRSAPLNAPLPRDPMERGEPGHGDDGQAIDQQRTVHDQWRRPHGHVGHASHDGTDRHDEQDEASAVLHLALLSATTALAMQGLAHAPIALTYLGERGVSLAVARRCRLGFLDDVALLDYLGGDRQLARVAQQMGLLNRLRRGTLARRLIVPEVRNGRTTQLIGRVLPGAGSVLPHIKYYLVCGNGEKGLLGYGAALERLGAGTAGTTTADTIDTRQSPRGPGGNRHLRGILVLEGALDFVIAIGWNLPILPVALLSTYPSRAQLGELLDLRIRAGGLPLLLMHDADGAGREGMAHLARMLTERQIPFSVVPPLSRPPTEAEPAYFKDLAEMGPLGRAGRLHMLDALARTPIPTADPDTTRDEPSERRG